MFGFVISYGGLDSAFFCRMQDGLHGYRFIFMFYSAVVGSPRDLQQLTLISASCGNLEAAESGKTAPVQVRHITARRGQVNLMFSLKPGLISALSLFEQEKMQRCTSCTLLFFQKVHLPFNGPSLN